MRAVIIGGGVGGLAMACLLGKAGYQVTLFEKNEQLGGRAGLLEAGGFRFDTGPSWYLMPEVFEHFFALLGEDIREHLALTKLAPSYRAFFKGSSQHLDITSDLPTDAASFEAIEPGAGRALRAYTSRSALMYRTALDHFLYKNYDSLRDFWTPEVVRAGVQLSIFKTMHHQASAAFRDLRLQQLVEYPAMFLGTSPYRAPALYTLMSHLDFGQGVWYPQGGMYGLVQALRRIGARHGVTYQLQAAVERIVVRKGQAAGVVVDGEQVDADIVISDADPQYTETHLLAQPYRDHPVRYWQRRVLAPSALLLYLGVGRQYDSLAHHNLLFSSAWQKNFAEIFGSSRSAPPRFPTDPSLYICAPSKTDPSVAPPGKENLFVLVPLAAGLQYTAGQLASFARRIIRTLEHELRLPDLHRHIAYRKFFCVQDFASRYHSPHGSALGLAHTLRQTAVFRPANRSSAVSGLYYVGANVHPGIGLPTTLISAELVYKRLIHNTSNRPLASL